jgi:membrane protease YdiL (CAAX protease family)
MPIWGAIAVQSVIFGFAHFTPSEGWGNVTMVLALGTVGFVLGVIAYATGRLWTGMVAHAVFNCFQLTMLWLTL